VSPAVPEPVAKRTKLRDTRDDSKVKENKCVDLDVDHLKILTPGITGNVRYFGRIGTAELFIELADLRKGEVAFNIKFVGAPGTGKSNLVWAVAEHLASQGKSVVWASRRSKAEAWTVRQFDGKCLNKCWDLPSTLGKILKLEAFSNTTVLILDSPLSVSDGDDGIQGYEWAGGVGIHGGRVGERRVIHVSSLGASTQKGTEVQHFNLKELLISPWTRKDFIDALADESLKKKVCITLDIDDVSTVTAEEVVDRKFFYSGINARWFFNFKIKDIKAECKSILGRMSPNATQYGDAHVAAVNSAFQTYWIEERRIILFTSSYLALSMGIDEVSRGVTQFLTNYPLIKAYLGNGSPGEIFEADFAIHLQHMHDIADATRAVMGADRGHEVFVRLGIDESKTIVLWPTGKLFKLPPAAKDSSALQTLPDAAIKNVSERVAKWFIPESKNQPFLDFFVLIPEGNDKWQMRAIQSTVGKTHTADIEQLKRVVGGVIKSGFDLCDDVHIVFIIEDKHKQAKIGMNVKYFTIPIIEKRLKGKGNGRESTPPQKFLIKELRVEFARTGSTPR
jgi:adenylate kinase family enzyme